MHKRRSVFYLDGVVVLERVALIYFASIIPMGNPPTPAEGTGTVRVRKTEPPPLPQCTLPKTRTGS